MRADVRLRDSTDPVTAHVAALDRALRGPAKARRSLVREAWDGLDDAVDAYRRGGLSHRAAARRAVRDFGPVHETAALYQDELAAGQGRRTALLLGAGVPALMLGWELIWHAGLGWTTAAATAAPTLRVLTTVQEVVTGMVGAMALALVALTFRRTRSPRRVVTAVAVTALLTIAVCGGTTVVLNLINPPQFWTVLSSRPPVVAGWLANAAMLILISGSTVRTLRTLPRTRRLATHAT